MKNKILILICGGSGSGKTTFSKEIQELLPNNINSKIICQDSFYKDFIDFQNNQQLNYDHPSSFEWNEIHKVINDILNNKNTKLPVYDYHKRKRIDSIPFNEDIDVIIFEGIYAIFDTKLNELANLKIFIETDLDECLIRRIERDTKQRGRSLNSIIEQWRNFVKPMYNQFIYPLKTSADIIIPWNSTNKKSFEILNLAITNLLNK